VLICLDWVLMRRLIRSANHAAALLRNLGLRRFTIVVLSWLIRRHRSILAPMLRIAFWRTDYHGVSQDPILVYQMAKVGSTSLLYSLHLAYMRRGLANVPIHHVHTLTNLDAHERLARESRTPDELLGAVREYRKIRSNFEAQPQQHWTTITMVRDPVARQISDYFHHIDNHLPDWRRRWIAGSLTIEEVMHSFLNAPDHAPFWFDAEIKSVLGIDVFSSPFAYEAGYQVYFHPPKVTLLVMRLEDMNRVASHAVEQLLGVTGFKLHSFNAGSETAYSDLYKAFRSHPLPASYVDSAYAHKLARHFYSDSERDAFFKKWTHARSDS
jgi:hypothetical protein